MPNWSPRTLTIVEANPETIQGYDIFVKDLAETPLAQTSVLINPSGTTVIPVGSNGLFDSLTEGQQVNFYLGRNAAPGHGENLPLALVEGGPYTLVRLIDDNFTVSVTT